MRKMRTSLRVLVPGALAILLASCSGEPSESDIANALQKAMKAEREQLEALGAGLMGKSAPNPMSDMLDIRIADVEKIGCQESGKNAYTCDVRYKVSGGLAGSAGRSMSAPVRMISASEGWVVSGN